jgi:NAD(P)-dependent dehydrogenase (short-subunit alcohol dehydrogenase family)
MQFTNKVNSNEAYIYIHIFLEVFFITHAFFLGIVLISGASTGIGKHAAVELAKLKPQYTVLAGVRRESDFNLILDEGLSNLKPILLDVTSYSSCVDAIEKISSEIATKKQPLIALVNNAGISRNIPVEFHHIDDVKLIFETNFFGMLQLTQLAIPLLRSSAGRIVMISSVAGFIGNLLLIFLSPFSVITTF